MEIYIGGNEFTVVISVFKKSAQRWRPECIDQENFEKFTIRRN